MATKKIETQAVISAKDATGSTFAEVAQKIQKLVNTTQRADATVGRTVRQTAAAHERSSGAMRNMASLAGIAAVSKAHQLASTVIDKYREFDDLVRYQRAILGISTAQQKPMIDQAISLGSTTKFNDLQVLGAQLSLAQRHIQADMIIPITKFAADFGQAMDIDLPSAAKALETAVFTTGQKMETSADALKSSSRMVDLMTKAAKIGGLDAEELSQTLKFGGASANTAGLSVETMLALAALMKRGGIPGSDSGVAIRSISGSLVAPTPGAMTALDAIGVDYNKFVKMPGGLSVDNFNKSLKRNLGQGLSKHGKSLLGKIFSDPEIYMDQTKFTPAIADALGKGPGGFKSKKTLASLINSFWQTAIKGVDTEGLLRAIIAANPSAAQSNKLFTKMQGGRFETVAKRGLNEFNSYFEQLKNVAEGFAHDIGEQRMAGFAGAMSRAEGAALNLATALGRANDSMLTGGANIFGRVVQHIAQMDAEFLRASTEVAAVALALTGLKSVGVLAGGFGLKGSAAALDESAVALREAAVLLSGGKVAGLPGVGGGPGGKKAGGGPGFWSPLWQAAGYSYGTDGIDWLFDHAPHPKFPSGYTPGGAGPMSLISHAGDVWNDFVSGTSARGSDFTLGSSGHFQSIAPTEVGGHTFGRISRRTMSRAGGSPGGSDLTVALDPNSRVAVTVKVEVNPSSVLLEALAETKAKASGNTAVSIGGVGKTTFGPTGEGH